MMKNPAFLHTTSRAVLPQGDNPVTLTADKEALVSANPKVSPKVKRVKAVKRFENRRIQKRDFMLDHLPRADKYLSRAERARRHPPEETLENAYLIKHFLETDLPAFWFQNSALKIFLCKNTYPFTEGQESAVYDLYDAFIDQPALPVLADILNRLEPYRAILVRYQCAQSWWHDFWMARGYRAFKNGDRTFYTDEKSGA